MFRARLHLVLLLVVLGLVLVLESQEPTFQKLESFASSWLHKIPDRKKPVAPVTLVEIDQASLKEHRWPWTPLDFALFFQAVNDFQPAVLASHEIFSWKESKFQDAVSSKIPQYRNLLRDHLLRSQKVVLGGLLGFPEDVERLPPLQECPVLRSFRGDPKEVPEFTDLAARPDEDFRLCSALGFSNAPPERPLHSHIPLVWRYRGQLVPSLTLQAAILWEKATLDEVLVHLGHSIRIGNRLQIPINSRGEMLVNTHAPFGRCSYEDLLLAANQKEGGSPPKTTSPAALLRPIRPLALFPNRLVLLARTDSDSQSISAPGLSRLSLGEWNALALATITSRSFPPPAPPWTQPLIIGVAALLSLITGRQHWLRPCFVVPAALLAHLAAALVTFHISHVTLPMLLPAGLGLLLLVSPWISPTPLKPSFEPPAPAPVSHPETPEIRSLKESAADSANPTTAAPSLPISGTPHPQKKDSTASEIIPIPPLLLFPQKPDSLTATPVVPAAHTPATTPSLPPPAFRPTHLSTAPPPTSPESKLPDSKPPDSPKEPSDQPSAAPCSPAPKPKVPASSQTFTLQLDSGSNSGPMPKEKRPERTEGT